MRRAAVLEALGATPDGALVLVVAPAGYGKSTTTLQWGTADRRDLAWASLGPADDDPVHLVQHLALAVHQVRPLPEVTTRLLLAPGRSAELDLVPALARALEQLDDGVLLVVDDVHLLASADATACLDGLLALAPPSLTVALVGRSQPIPMGRRRVERTVVEVGLDQLAMAADEAAELLGGAGATLAGRAVDDLVQRTEGWPAGLRLAAVLEQRSVGSEAATLSGRHRLVADYLVEEVLAGLDPDRVRFLEDSSVLGEMSPTLVDELLGRDDAGQVLREVESSTGAFLVPLDAERERYRYHHLFGEMLQARLRDRDAERSSELHARASQLAAASGDTDAAITHAVQAGDRSRAIQLVLAEAAGLVLQGRVQRFGRWLAEIGDEGVEDDPSCAFVWAWYGLNAGDPSLAVRGLVALRGADPDAPLGAALMVDAGTAMISAMVAADGALQVVEDAEVVRARCAPDTPWWTIATVVRAGAELMLARFDVSRELLLRLRTTVDAAPALDALALAHLALLDLERGAWDEAERTGRRSLQLAEAHDLEGVSSLVAIFAVGALVEARRPDRPAALELVKASQRMLARLGDLSPRTQLHAYVLLARAHLALGSPADARLMATEADRFHQREAGAPALTTWLADVHEQLRAAQDHELLPGQRLTPAELRLLPHLATHLSLQEIADRLHVSRNTTKSQSVAVYRKLQVQSRSAAVEEARRRGYLSL